MKKIVLLSFIFLGGCTGGADVADLEQFVASTTAKPKGRIKPLPEFQPYSAFIYSASAMRSPFESPVAFEEMSGRFANNVDAPDEKRRKGPLERYPMGELTLVGTMAKADGNLNALIQTSAGNVHLARSGEYMGRNHGRIVNISETKIELIEVVPNGNGGWISRPDSMGLKESVGSE
jgi:type IV pilus assembly protein PilP